MPLNKIPRLREPRGPVVQQVRDLFLEREFKASPDEYYQQDVKLVENMDFIVQRCVIMQRKDVEASVKMLSQLLKWRKEKKLYELTDCDFPQELTMSGAAFLYECDKYGNKMLYLRVYLCKSCSELKPALKDFLTYLLYQLDDPKDGHTYSIVMDLTNASLSNYDVELLMHVVNSLKDHYPVNMDYFLAVNFPWILSAAWALIKRLIPSERRDAIQFINSNKIFDYVAKENCPDFLGGTCTRPYVYVNEQAPTTVEYLIQKDKAPLKKRMWEILNMFAETFPKEHIKKLKQQIEQVDDDAIAQKKGVISEAIHNNNNGEDLNKSPTLGH